MALKLKQLFKKKKSLPTNRDLDINTSKSFTTTLHGFIKKYEKERSEKIKSCSCKEE